MKAQISFEMMIWVLASIAFLSFLAVFSYHLLHNWPIGKQESLYAGVVALANRSVQPYSEFGILVKQNAT